MKDKCLVDGCDSQSKSKGLCNRHYLRLYRERTRKERREKQRAYYYANIEKRRAASRTWAVNNAEKKKVYSAAYHQVRKEELRTKRQVRYKSDLAYRLRINLRNRLNAAIRLKCRAGSAVRDLGCSIDDFIIHIASKFQPGMTWLNWGEWHIDHIKPLSDFCLSDRSQFLSACHYTNMQPLWAADNYKKGNRLPPYRGRPTTSADV